MSDDLARAEALFAPSKPAPSKARKHAKNAQGKPRRRIVRAAPLRREPVVQASASAVTPLDSPRAAAKLLELPPRPARRRSTPGSPLPRSPRSAAPSQAAGRPAVATSVASLFKVLVELVGESVPRTYVVEAGDLDQAVSRAEHLLGQRLSCGSEPVAWTLRSVCRLPCLPA